MARNEPTPTIVSNAASAEASTPPVFVVTYRIEGDELELESHAPRYVVDEDFQVEEERVSERRDVHVLILDLQGILVLGVYEVDVELHIEARWLRNGEPERNRQPYKD